MYLSYYNLKAKPFQMSTDPDFLWLGEKHKEALAVLKYAILENKGVLALTGDVGTGKTTLINALLKSLGKNTITATIYDARLDVLDFFNTVAAAFKIDKSFEGKGKFILHFMEFLIEAHKRNQKVLLIIDEAQGINEDLLEEIRLLSNLEAEYTRLLNIFFVGQNEFIDILQKYENRALRQRVTIRYHIDPLTLNETAAYIRHRLEVGGSTAPIFDSNAIDEIFFFSSGYPRLINIMCDHALLTGYVREVRTINANLIRECREELLVSKKTSGTDFEYPAENQRAFPGEPMVHDPLRGSFVYVKDAQTPEDEQEVPDSQHSMHQPEEEPTAPETSKQPFVYVRDPQIPRDKPEEIGPKYSMRKPARRSRKVKKKRFLGFRSILIFIFVVGLGTGYFFYGNDYKDAESFVTRTQQQVKKYFSMNATSKNDRQLTAQAQPETLNTPKHLQSEDTAESRFAGADALNSGLSEKTAPKETDSFQSNPPRTFPQNAGASAFSEKSDKSESFDKSPAVKTLKTVEPAELPKDSGVEPPKETASTTTKGSGAVKRDLNPKTETAALLSKKTPVKSPAVAPMPSIPSKETPGRFPSPTLKPDKDQIKASKPAPVHATPNQEKTIKKGVVKPSEKPKTPESTSHSALTQNKAKKPNPQSGAKPRSGAVVLSSESSRKPVIAPIQKKPINPPVKKTDEKIASLSAPANRSEKAGKTVLPYVGLMTRLKAFLNEYCRTYEQKNIDKFRTFFALNAVEKGKPFRSWLPKYRQNFSRIDSIEYNINLDRYATQEETGLVKIDGTFHVRAKLNGAKEWLKNSGPISMILETDGDSFKVIELDY